MTMCSAFRSRHCGGGSKSACCAPCFEDGLVHGARRHAVADTRRGPRDRVVGEAEAAVDERHAFDLAPLIAEAVLDDDVIGRDAAQQGAPFDAGTALG